MDLATARELSRLTGDFYARTSASFAQTRTTPWSGWQRVIDELGTCGTADGPAASLRVVDLACGNLRFERLLAGAASEGRVPSPIEVHALDSCDAMLDEPPITGVAVTYTHLDIAEVLFAGDALQDTLGTHVADLAVCFGFMHHLCLPTHRQRVLEALVESVVPGGMIAVSFWQLSKSERLLGKARAVTELAVTQYGLYGLEEGDYLLGWQDRTDVLRYCHDFSEQEIDDLAQAVASAEEVARFSADGATGNLNRYLIMRRLP